MIKNLNEVDNNVTCFLVNINADFSTTNRLLELGFTKDVELKKLRSSISKKTICILCRETVIGIRSELAKNIIVRC